MTNLVETTINATTPFGPNPVRERDEEKINLKLQHELTVDEKNALLKDPTFEDKYDTIKGWTWDDCLTFFKNENPNFKIKNLENYSNQSTSLLVMKLAPTINAQIKNANDVETVIEWANYLNTETEHIHSIVLDEILEKSTEIILDKINFLPGSSKKVADEIKEIFKIAGKNCSPNFLTTYHGILEKIVNCNKLKDSEKENIYIECLSTLCSAVRFAMEDEIFSPFITGKYHLLTVIQETGKDLNDFSQADLNDIIENLFKIYFGITENFDLSDTDKWDIFTKLIPYDNTGKRDFVMNKISEMIEQEDFQTFSKHFATSILETILTSEIAENTSNKNAKLKCVEIIGNLYASDIKKNSELDGYIKSSFDNDNQLPDVNQILLKNLIEKYNSQNIEEKIQENLFNLIEYEFTHHIDYVIELPEFMKCIDIFLKHPENSAKEKCIEKLIHLICTYGKNEHTFSKFIENSFFSNKTDPIFLETIFNKILFGYDEKDISEMGKSCLYDLIKNIYKDHFEIIKNFKNFYKCLDIFVEKQDNNKIASDARKNLELFLRSNIPTKQSVGITKKQFLDGLEDKYRTFNKETKKNLIILISDVLDFADDELTNEFIDTITKKFIMDEFESHSPNGNFVLQIGRKDSVSTANKWFKIILDSTDSKNDCDEIFNILKKEIIYSNISVQQRRDCYSVIRNSLRYKNDDKSYIKFSIEILLEMIGN